MKRVLIGIAMVLLVCVAFTIGMAYYYFQAPQFYPPKTVHLYIDRDDTIDSVLCKLSAQASPRCLTGFRLMAKHRGYEGRVRTGRYAVSPGENVRRVFNRFYLGNQAPINLTVGSTRSIGSLCRHVARQLMIDSAEIADVLADTARIQSMGYNQQTLYALFLPDTYQVYWDLTAEQFIDRMKRENTRFWNEHRQALADSLGLTPLQVTTLASIVEEETNRSDEKPIIAGLYLNRLRRGMLLQADPTVKFAVGDPSLRRVLLRHLNVHSPYNTYLYPGLPPGPIRIATPQGIDAVLHASRHNYLYMCANEDFSGTHRFASTLAEHNRNAARYQAALNRRKIYQ